MKRECNASGEGVPSKRQRLTSGAASSTASNNERALGPQIEDLIETIVRSTDEWPSHLLESLFSSLELAMESNGDLFATVNEYVVRHKESKGRARARTKQEENWSIGR